MRVTIRQIAEESGVSRGTVDRVLNNRGKVRPEVEERVRKVAEELGYKPNLLGRALIKMKENIKIGVILQDTGTPYLKTLSDGIKKAKGEVEDFGGTVIVKAVDYGNVEQTLAAMNKLKEAGIKGLVLMPINDKRVLQKDRSVYRRIWDIRCHSECRCGRYKENLFCWTELCTKRQGSSRINA